MGPSGEASMKARAVGEVEDDVGLAGLELLLLTLWLRPVLLVVLLAPGLGLRLGLGPELGQGPAEKEVVVAGVVEEEAKVVMAKAVALTCLTPRPAEEGGAGF
jgi:hypothetical protein